MRGYLTDQIRRMEKDPSAAKLERFRAKWDKEGVSLEPWRKRLDALERLVAVHEVMES